MATAARTTTPAKKATPAPAKKTATTKATKATTPKETSVSAETPTAPATAVPDPVQIVRAFGDALTGDVQRQQMLDAADTTFPKINAGYALGSKYVAIAREAKVSVTDIEGAAKAEHAKVTAKAAGQDWDQLSTDEKAALLKSAKTNGLSAGNIGKYQAVGNILRKKGALPARVVVAPTSPNGIEGVAPLLTEDGKIVRDDDGKIVRSMQVSLYSVVVKAIQATSKAKVDDTIEAATTARGAYEAVKALLPETPKAKKTPASLVKYAKAMSGPASKIETGAATLPFGGTVAEAQAALDKIKAAAAVIEAAILAEKTAAKASAPAA